MTRLLRSVCLGGVCWVGTFLIGGVGLAADPQPGAVSDSMGEFLSPEGWNVGLNYLHQRRELKTADELLDMRAWHAWPQVAYKPVKWLALEAGLGAAKADWDDRDGEVGLDWVVGARASFLEYVIEKSPVLGKQQCVRLGAVLAYRQSESNDSDNDLKWKEIAFSPLVSYSVNLRGPERWHPYDPLAVTVRAGLIFSDVNGEYGGQDLSANRDFGFTCGIDWQLPSGFVTGVDILSFGEEALSVALTLSYNL